MRRISFVIPVLFFFISKAQDNKQFHPDSLRNIVEVLAADSMKGRFSGSAQSIAASRYIADEFKKAGLLPLAGNDGFFMKVRNNWYNVMGAIPGRSKKGEAIIFSAHYDHVGTRRTNPHEGFGGQAHVEPGDSIYNGANDNASGTSAVITLARHFAKQKDNERTLIFIAFVGEELQMIGSSAAAHLFEPDSVVAMINIEMIGRNANGIANPYITGGEYSGLQRIMNDNLHVLNKKKFGKRYFRNDPFEQHRLFFRSDNLPFVMKRIAAHTIMVTSPDDDYYHNLNDEPWTLDYDLMSRVVHAIALSCQGLVRGIDHPGKARSF